MIDYGINLFGEIVGWSVLFIKVVEQFITRVNNERYLVWRPLRSQQTLKIEQIVNLFSSSSGGSNAVIGCIIKVVPITASGPQA